MASRILDEDEQWELDDLESNFRNFGLCQRALICGPSGVSSCSRKKIGILIGECIFELQTILVGYQN